MIDLHTHSTASDGSLSPGALIRAAADRGLTAIALTDHDTIAGLEEARLEAELRGIRFIPGVEISVEPDPEKYPGEFHLLGLGITRPSAAFLEAVDQLARSRTERNREILDRMNEQGVEADYEEVRSFSGGHSVGRPHFARLLIRRKLVKNVQQAFDRYLAEGKPFYVPKTGMNFDKAVAAIKGSGGIAVLAHPLSLFVAWGRLPGLIQGLKEKGLDGLEAWHPAAKESACKRLEALGKSLGLIITAGSDFHGEARPDRKLGITAGGRKIGEEYLAAIVPRTFQSTSTEKIS
ncbi:phosphatase [Spirochaetia bacterium]|nr:phosphatase [Spirochaetia bacterium]